MYIYFHDLFDLSIKQGGGGCREKLDHRVKRKLRMCVFMCVGGESVLTIFYSSQAPMKRVWNPLLPQINITEQKGRPSLKTSLNQPRVLHWDRMNAILSWLAYMLISPSRDDVVSYSTIHILSRSG